MTPYLEALGNNATVDNIIKGAIEEAQSNVERDCQMFLTQRVIKSRPVESTETQGTTFDVADDAYDFVRDDYRGFGTFRLRKRPIVSIQRVTIRYGADLSSIVKVIDYPSSWLSFDARLGVLYIVPLVGLTSQQAAALLLIPIFGAGLGRWAGIPLIATLDYTAGFLPKSFKPETEDAADKSPDHDVRELLTAVRYLATAVMLRKAQRGILPGGGSTATEGLSQSFAPRRFGAEIDEYEAAAQRIKDAYNGQFGPVRAFVF